MFPHDSPSPRKWKVHDSFQLEFKLKLFNCCDDYFRTSGSLLSPVFRARKNRWSGKGIKGGFDFLVQGITAYYESKHSVSSSFKPPLVADCVSQPSWCGQSLAQAWLSRSHLKMFEEHLTGGRLGFLDWCCSGAILLWSFLSSPRGPVKPDSLLLNDHGIQTEKQAASPALHLNSQSSRGGKANSSCPISTENPKETDIWVATSFLKLNKREGH